MSGNATLRLDWCSHDAAKYAVEKWHYSKSLPPPPHNRVGVWERGEFIGVVLFSRGANNNLLKKYGLAQTEGCELTRVALAKHSAPVSRIVAIACKFLAKQSPGVRVVVSFADPSEGHHGGIYQALGWLYEGQTPPSIEYVAPDGKQWHGRMVKKKGWTVVYGKRRATWKPEQCRPVTMQGKHRYALALDASLRPLLESMRQPYPKRVKHPSDALGHQSGEGGAAPTHALQTSVS